MSTFELYENAQDTIYNVPWRHHEMSETLQLVATRPYPDIHHGNLQPSHFQVLLILSSILIVKAHSQIFRHIKIAIKLIFNTMSCQFFEIFNDDE